MNKELNELYQQVILDHNKSPRNFGELDGHTHSADGHNPLCGDQITVELIIDNNVITDVKFNGSGCAISKASASIMTTLVKGKTIEEAKELFDKFHTVVTTDPDEIIDPESLGKMAVFAGVHQFPARVKCAGLAWHTLKAAIEEKTKASTE